MNQWGIGSLVLFIHWNFWWRCFISLWYMKIWYFVLVWISFWNTNASNNNCWLGFSWVPVPKHKLPYWNSAIDKKDQVLFFKMLCLVFINFKWSKSGILHNIGVQVFKYIIGESLLKKIQKTFTYCLLCTTTTIQTENCLNLS